MSQNKTVDVYGVGNALVDILAFVEDSFVEQMELAKGSMTLVEGEKRGAILSGLEGKSLNKRSGGSAANSLIALAQSGGSSIFAGRVADDENGKLYINDLKETGVGYELPAVQDADQPTGTSIILTTPDAERTMCTNLAISVLFNADDIKADQVERCKVCYVEGYLWAGPDTKAAAVKAIETAKASGTLVSMTFSDAFVVDLFKDYFQELVPESCDIIFCNSDEARKYVGNDDLQVCAEKLGKQVKLAFITDGANGAIVVDNGVISNVEGFEVNAIDTVGAGDAFAGGVLYGITHGLTAAQAAKWGNYLASEVVQVQGPRLEKNAIRPVEEIVG